MNNKSKRYLIAWAILFVAFNAITFIIPAPEGFIKYDGAFWTSLIIIDAAMIGQLAVTLHAFNTGSITKLFYNLPMIRISYTGMIIMIIVGVCAMVIPDLPCWVGAVAAIIVAMFTGISIVKASGASDAIEKVDKDVKAKTVFIKLLTTEANALMNSCESSENKEVCRKVYEAIRFSDPMSAEALSGDEAQITLKFNELKNAVSEGKNELVAGLAEEVLVLVAARNQKCKALK